MYVQIDILLLADVFENFISKCIVIYELDLAHFLSATKNCFVHMRALKQALNYRWILKKVHNGIEVNQEAWLKLYVDIIIKLRTEAKDQFEKDFLKQMNNTVFGTTMENIRKHRNNKLKQLIKEEINYCQNLITIQPNIYLQKRNSNQNE